MALTSEEEELRQWYVPTFMLVALIRKGDKGTRKNSSEI